jgi:hypothetical protein
LGGGVQVERTPAIRHRLAQPLEMHPLALDQKNQQRTMGPSIRSELSLQLFHAWLK